jgi:type IV pilus assembly protein PilP
MKRQQALAIVLFGANLLVAGCNSGHDDLKAFVARVRANAPASAIKPLPKIVAYHPYTYHAAGRRAPFTPSASSAASQPQHNGLAPDFNRPRGPLEHFPLDALQWVGTIASQGVTYALIRAPDNVIYRATRGDHLGEHFGTIQSVSEAGVTLVEIVPDGTGGYVKKDAALAPPE